ncbi:MAG: hypothetical protein NC936_05330 [Candidatus Omnitrophica bacterium]|nr:hypothetical protein [Candidatus Omnitrophota bacterium]
MRRSIFFILLLLSILMVYNWGWSAEIQIGGTQFEGKVVVYDDGRVETNFADKEVEVEGEGRKRVKVKFVEGRFVVVDFVTNEEMALNKEGKFIKKSRLGLLQLGQQTGEATTGASSTPNASQKPSEEKLSETIDISIFEVALLGGIFVNRQTNIEVTIFNDSEQKLDNCLLAIEIEDGFREKRTVSLKPRERQKQIFRWIPHQEGRLRLTAVLRAPQDIQEKNTRNNEKTTFLQVLSKPKEEFSPRQEEPSRQERAPVPERGLGSTGTSNTDDNIRRR